ncbi:MAG: DinB family protein [Leptospiraceae bacterium]
MLAELLNCHAVRPLPEVHSTESISALLEQCESIQKAVETFIREIPLEYLNEQGYPEGWSPARNIKHVGNSLTLFSKFIGAPAWFIALFGKAKASMPPIESVRPTNRPPRYDYGTYKPGKPCTEEKREALIQGLARSFERFKKSLQKRNEEEMDRRKGLFGGMSLRLFAHFVLKHTVFHLQVVRTRLQTASELAG